MDEEEIKQRATEFAKANKERIAQELTDQNIFPPEITPISIFMAGSPGAGKTEFSKSLVDSLKESDQIKRIAIRIDADELRTNFPEYRGKNSYLFQYPTSILVDKIHDCALEQNQTFIFDSTFANYERAVKNIQRSLDKNRKIIIFYMYQTPIVAWNFTKEREEKEGRNIPKDAFIERFLAAKETIKKIRSEFESKVQIIAIVKNFEKNTVEKILDFMPGMQIDDIINEKYTKDDLEKAI